MGDMNLTEENCTTQNSIATQVSSLRALKGHTCNVCQKWFKRSSDLRRHGNVHIKIKEKLLPCNHCNGKFSNKYSLQQHLRYHGREKTYKCEFCQKSFKSTNHLKNHVISHTQERPYKCEMCNKSFGRKNALEYHYASKTNLDHHRKFDEFKQFEYLVEKYKQVDINRHACPLCDKQYSIPSQLQLHFVTHTIERPYECNFCGIKFKRKDYLKRHKDAQHSNVRMMYPCDICNKLFVSKYSVSVHKGVVHVTEKPFECKTCSQTFAKEFSLRRHMVCHTNIRKHACIMCDKKYLNLSSLKYHMREHTGEKPYVCQVCNKSFRDSTQLKRHRKKCQEKETTSKTVKSIDSTINIIQPKVEKINSDVNSIIPKTEKIDSDVSINKNDNLDFALTEKSLKETILPSAVVITKEMYSNGDDGLAFKNVKFVKVENTAELNLLRITRLFQRYKNLSNLCSK